MKLSKTLLLFSGLVLLVACTSTKKTTAPTVSAAPETTSPSNVSPSGSPTVSGPLFVKKKNDGVSVPGDEELAAIQLKYKDVTLQTLTEGHAIYTGACTNCHGAKNIYNLAEEEWQGIMDEMAPKAKLTDSQKDAVYKYVLAVKATQSKNANE